MGGIIQETVERKGINLSGKERMYTLVQVPVSSGIVHYVVAAGVDEVRTWAVRNVDVKKKWLVMLSGVFDRVGLVVDMYSTEIGTHHLEGWENEPMLTRLDHSDAKAVFILEFLLAQEPHLQIDEIVLVEGCFYKVFYDTYVANEPRIYIVGTKEEVFHIFNDHVEEGLRLSNFEGGDEELANFFDFTAYARWHEENFGIEYTLAVDGEVVRRDFDGVSLQLYRASYGLERRYGDKYRPLGGHNK